MSEIKVNSVVNSTGDNDSGLDLSTNDNIKFKIANSEKAIIDSNGRLGIKTSSPSALLHLGNADNKGMMITSSTSNAGHLNVFQDQVILSVNRAGADGSFADTGKASSAIKCIATNGDGNITFSTTATNNTDSTQRMMIDKDGNVLVGTTDNNPNNNSADSTADNGIALLPSGLISIATHQNATMVLNRTGNNGNIIDLRRSGTTVGSIAVSGTSPLFGSDSLSRFVAINSNGLIPASSSTLGSSDNAMTLGQGSRRYSVVHAGTGSISTSDLQEKQDIEVFSDAEMKVAKKISLLFKKFKFKDAVTVKGDDARIHSGVIAQEIESAFKEEKLDSSNYAFWCKDTWKNDDGKEQTRYAIRYNELLSFICAYNEQRFSSIEARLTALESK